MVRLNPPGVPLVLLVEDEPLVRMVNLEVLQEAGFRVIDANDADEAFEILKRRSDQVRAVLTDVDMPGSMNGFEFARLVSQGWPAIGVLVISGKTSPGPRDLPKHGMFLAKPYGTEEMIEALKRLIGEPAPVSEEEGR
jgi:CheY-like chemotaxis protein